MKKLIVPCLVAALLGAIVATWSHHESSLQVSAQDRGSARARQPVAAINDVEKDRGVNSQRLPAPRVEPELEEYTPEERVNIYVYEKANRSVVHITTKVYTQETFLNFEVPSDGAGSGSVLDKHGHILTNFHVIEGATEVKVTLFNGESFDAKLVGRDPSNDIAVLRIAAPAELLFPIELGDSSRLRVGQRVLAIGNPFGLERTLTVGTLSSLNRRLPSRAVGREIKSVIQVDAALNRGNSGGPLLNSHGQLIGMNTAIASQTGANTGVGFSVPVNTIRRVVPQLIENGRVIRPVIGVESVYETDNGLQIIKVTPGGPAERAGLRGFRVVRKRENRGLFTLERETIDRAYADTITGIDGRPVRSGDELLDLIEAKRPGDSVTLRVIRGGAEMDVAIVLGASE